MRAGSLVLRRRGRGDYTCFREGVHGPPCRWHSRVPEDAREVGRGSGGFPGGKPVNVCASDLLYSERVGDGASGASATAMGPEWEVSQAPPTKNWCSRRAWTRAVTHERTLAASSQQSDDTRPKAEPAARVTTRSSRSAFPTNGRSGAHTLAGFPSGNLLGLPFAVSTPSFKCVLPLFAVRPAGGTGVGGFEPCEAHSGVANEFMHAVAPNRLVRNDRGRSFSSRIRQIA